MTDLSQSNSVQLAGGVARLRALDEALNAERVATAARRAAEHELVQYVVEDLENYAEDADDARNVIRDMAADYAIEALREAGS